MLLVRLCPESLIPAEFKFVVRCNLVDFPAFNEVSVLFDTLKTDVQAAVADGSFTLGLQAKASNLAGGSLALISVSVSVVESTLIAIMVPPTAVPTGHPISDDPSTDPSDDPTTDTTHCFAINLAQLSAK